MSSIVLSASVRQNLLSLQSTADLLSTTQNRLATGNKVNSALDNPTNFFTAQGLNNRATDINNLLDSIGNGVQVLQAANTGITSLQKLVDTAKSIANQVLQAPAGYSVKASATTAAPTGAGPLAVAGTVTDLTNAGTNSLNGETFVFTPAVGAATTITVSSTVAAGNVNSIDAFNAALSSAGIGLTASLAANGSIGFTSTNDNASQTLTARHDGSCEYRCAQRHRHICACHPRRGHRRQTARRRGFPEHSFEPGEAVQRHHHADHDDGAGFVLQWHQSAERR